MVVETSAFRTKRVDFDPFAGPKISRVVSSTESQRKIWLASQSGGADASCFPNRLDSLWLEGTFDRLALEQAMQTLVSRHDAVRSVFSADGQRRHILEDVRVDVSYKNLTEQSAAEQALRMAAYLKQETRYVFKLTAGPLLRAGLFTSSSRRHQLVLTSHPILFDGGSMDGLLRELANLYSDYACGVTPALPKTFPVVRAAEVPVSFAGHDEFTSPSSGVQPRPLTDYPRQTPVHALLAQTAVKHPGHVALIFNDRQLTYREVNETANQLAHLLIRRGINVGDIVGLSVDRSPEMLITLLAILKAGAAYLPLDPDYPADRLAFMLSDSAARLLITTEKQGNRLNGAAPTLLLEDALAESSGYATQEPNRFVTGHDLAYVLYTSGSTGKPKGVLIEHHSLVNFLWSMRQTPGIGPNDVLLAITTISFDIAGLELYLPLLVGATVLLADAETARDGRTLLDLIRSKRVSLLQATPSTWRMLLDAGWNDSLPLKALCGGEALPKDVADKLLRRCRELWNVYGPTETTIWSTVKRVTDADLITIGQPIHNTQVYILDEFGQPVAEGIAGEIYVGGDGVSRGYLNRPALTRERFLKNPWQPGHLYRTGDLGTWLPNGDVQCLGRIDNQVKIRGHRIELGEIEHVLTTLSDVKEAVVVARDARPGDPRLVAYVVPQSAATGDTLSSNQNLGVSPEQTRAWQQQIRLLLPDYMVPGDFVLLARLPLTPNHKIDKKALPSPETNAPRTPYVAPRTDVEQVVAGIWAECLKLDNVSVVDNFFELGGHSMIAIQVMTRLEKKTGKRLPLSTLFTYPTVETLAAVLRMDSKPITWDSLVPIKPSGTKTPLYIVHGNGLHVLLFNTLAKHMDADQPIYGLQAKGMNGTDEPLRSMEAMAAYYIEQITAQNPNGPYRLAGYSFGGLIAYEMSRQLRAAGKHVELLAVFDTHADEPHLLDSWAKRLWGYAQLRLNRYLYTLSLLKRDARGILRYKQQSVKRRVDYLRAKFSPHEDYHKLFYNSNHKVHESNRLAYRNYRLVPQDVKIELFRAEQRLYYTKDFDYLGWKSLALKGINVHPVPGDHATLFEPPNNQAFARILQTVLDNC